MQKVSKYYQKIKYLTYDKYWDFDLARKIKKY